MNNMEPAENQFTVIEAKRGVEKPWETCGQTALPHLDWLLNLGNDAVSVSLS